MLDSLGDAFRQAYENFRRELSRDRVPEAVDKLLRAMRDELTDIEAETRALERELEEVRAEAAREDQAARTCLRREELAHRIDDEETALVAREYAGRHLERHEILVEKADLLTREIAQRRSELEELTARFAEARERRDALTASAGRADARDSIRAADDLFAEMDRMSEKIQDLDAAGQAAEEMDRSFRTREVPPDPGPSEAELEARLAELKRRMADR